MERLVIGEGHLIGTVDDKTLALAESRLEEETPGNRIKFLKFNAEKIKSFTKKRKIRLVIEIVEE